MQNATELMEQIERAEQEKEFGNNSYNPQFDFLLQYRNGQTLSSVYGKIWRYCQMKRGKCEASKQRLAKELNLSEKTIKRAVDWLTGNGLIIDLTPDYGQARPHWYQINEDEHLLQTVAFNQYRLEDAPEIGILE